MLFHVRIIRDLRSRRRGLNKSQGINIIRGFTQCITLVRLTKMYLFKYLVGMKCDTFGWVWWQYDGGHRPHLGGHLGW